MLSCDVELWIDVVLAMIVPGSCLIVLASVPLQRRANVAMRIDGEA
jgi:hypothetical protein